MQGLNRFRSIQNLEKALNVAGVYRKNGVSLDNPNQYSRHLKNHLNIGQLLEKALAFHQTGQFRQAEDLYRQILGAEPNHADALHWLGVLAFQCSNAAASLELIGHAVRIDPNNALFWMNYGVTLRSTSHRDAAARAFSRAIELAPNFSDAYNALASIIRQQGDLQRAAELFRNAIDAKPDYAIAIANLGSVLLELNQLDEAIGYLKHARELEPANAEIAYNLGNAQKENGQIDLAIETYREALANNPSHPDACNNLANLLKEKGDLHEALILFQRLTQTRPDYSLGFHNLGTTLAAMGQLDDAVAVFQKAIELNPGFADALNAMGIALHTLGRLEESLEAFQKTIELRPEYADGYSNLGVVLGDLRRLDEAEHAYQTAIRIDPTSASAYNNLGFIYKDQGQLDRAVESYRMAMKLAPNSSELHSNLIYLLHFHPLCDNAAINREHTEWQTRHADPLRSHIKSHRNIRQANRRLRVGYVSPNFSIHVICYFLLPLLENHDHDQFEIVCYSSVKRPDSITQRISNSADLWRVVTGLNDSKVADIIREDEVDILLDLTQHMGGNRLCVFAEKPAPVQLAWLGYPGSNGLNTMDYRISDHVMEPTGAEWSQSVEKVQRLPHCWFVYDPLRDHPKPSPLPALRSGQVTFGCLNNFCKLNDQVFELWSGILAAVPKSRLLLQCPDGESRSWVLDFFSRRDVDPNRIQLVGRIHDRHEFLRLFDEIDIALDPFPYNGGTTTCEALWMGIPLLAIAGNRIVSRIGQSILTASTLSEFIADTPSEYIDMAARLAGDLPYLWELRRTLRDRVASSPFTDYPAFARDMESIYRTTWSEWCDNQ